MLLPTDGWHMFLQKQGHSHNVLEKSLLMYFSPIFRTKSWIQHFKSRIRPKEFWVLESESKSVKLPDRLVFEICNRERPKKIQAMHGSKQKEWQIPVNRSKKLSTLVQTFEGVIPKYLQICKTEQWYKKMSNKS